MGKLLFPRVARWKAPLSGEPLVGPPLADPEIGGGLAGTVQGIRLRPAVQGIRYTPGRSSEASIRYTRLTAFPPRGSQRPEGEGTTLCE